MRLPGKISLICLLLLAQGCETPGSPRTPTDLKAHIGALRDVPADCSAVWDDRRAEIADAERWGAPIVGDAWRDGYRLAVQLATLAGAEFTRGDARTAIKIVEKAIDAADRRQSLIPLYSLLALMKHAIGDFDGMRGALGVAADQMYSVPGYERRYAFYIYLAQGLRADGAGQLTAAEENFRKALELVSERFFYWRLNAIIDFDYVRARLVANLIAQEQLRDAELAAGDAIPRSPFFLESYSYSAGSARIWTQLAAVYLAMNRIDDAAFAISVAQNMIAYDCALLVSLSLRDAREIELKVDARR